MYDQQIERLYHPENFSEELITAKCWECDEELFTGTALQLENWAKKTHHDSELFMDEVEDGCVPCMCHDCSYIYHL